MSLVCTTHVFVVAKAHEQVSFLSFLSFWTKDPGSQAQVIKEWFSLGYKDLFWHDFQATVHVGGVRTGTSGTCIPCRPYALRTRVTCALDARAGPMIQDLCVPSRVLEWPTIMHGRRQRASLFHREIKRRSRRAASSDHIPPAQGSTTNSKRARYALATRPF